MRYALVLLLGALATVAAKADAIPHPPGCPRRAFCGCGLAVHVFGSPIRSLWPAANWLRFPRASPAPGTAAVHWRGHHVVGLESHVSGDVWLVYDANSGGGRTRLHARSIRGYTVVRPAPAS